MNNIPYWFLSNLPLPDGRLQWDFSGPLVLTALQANHPPGCYKPIIVIHQNVAAGAGNANNPVLAWTDPSAGASTLVFGTLSATGTGLTFSVSREIMSDGSAPITFTITPAGITGAPRANIMACCTFNSRLPW